MAGSSRADVAKLKGFLSRTDDYIQVAVQTLSRVVAPSSGHRRYFRPIHAAAARRSLTTAAFVGIKVLDGNTEHIREYMAVEPPPNMGGGTCTDSTQQGTRETTKDT